MGTTTSAVLDPFPMLATSHSPPIPRWNIPERELHKEYNISYGPPLLIGFTRNWPILLQAVVSYITAGWPAEQIYVVENTGTQWANTRDKLTPQNPFYLNHTQLKKLGVNVIQSPVLLSFAQLQNFFIYIAHQRKWQYYFWSHMDVVVMSLEDGGGRHWYKAGSPGYATIYEQCLLELRKAQNTDSRWALRFFAYDALTLVNRDASDAIGGWDFHIPYYITDCDAYQRFEMENFTISAVPAGAIHDVNTVFTNLLAFYRDPSVEIDFIDPNPPPPGARNRKVATNHELRSINGDLTPLEYWRKLKRERNTWQESQRGGQGEPYYYPAQGGQVAFSL